MFALLALGVPVGFAMGVSGAIGLYFIGGWDTMLGVLQTVPLSTVSSYEMITIPMFLLMAELVLMDAAMTKRMPADAADLTFGGDQLEQSMAPTVDSGASIVGFRLEETDANSMHAVSFGFLDWVMARSRYYLEAYLEPAERSHLVMTVGETANYFTLAIDVIDRVPRLQVAGAHVKESLRNQQIECRNYAHEHGIDRPSDRDWKWPL